jgi:peroxiredoxin family protein
VAGRAVIFLRSADWGARHLAVSLAVTAAALGDEVTLALFGEPLRAYVEGRFGEGAPASAGPARVPPLEATLAEARQDLGLRVVACDTAARLEGLEPGRIVPPLDAVVSLTELWRIAQVGRALSL